MSWDFNDGNTQSTANFTKFPVGITHIRVLEEQPKTRWVHWMPQFQKSVNCPGRGCPICEVRKQQKANKEPYTYSMSRRISINVYNKDQNRVEIMEQGVGFFEDLRDIREDLIQEGKTLDSVVLKVRRRGTGKDDTSYRIDVSSNDPMDEEESGALQDIVDMDEYFKPHTNEQILNLLMVRAETPDKYKEAWNNIMTNEEEKQEEDTEEEIEIQ